MTDANRLWKVGINLGTAGASKFTVWDFGASATRMVIDTSDNVYTAVFPGENPLKTGNESLTRTTPPQISLIFDVSSDQNQIKVSLTGQGKTGNLTVGFSSNSSFFNQPGVFLQSPEPSGRSI
jgi:hypothetical protein